MNTATPFPTLTPFPTPAGGAPVDLSGALDTLSAGELGPRAVQWWQMTVAPLWPGISQGVMALLVLILFFMFWYMLTNFTPEDNSD